MRIVTSFGTIRRKLERKRSNCAGFRRTFPDRYARIDPVGGNPGKAIEILQLSVPYELGSTVNIWLNPYALYVRGEAYLTARQGRAARAEFQKIIARREVVQNLPIGALARPGLARAYALVCDRAQARGF